MARPPHQSPLTRRSLPDRFRDVDHSKTLRDARDVGRARRRHGQNSSISSALARLARWPNASTMAKRAATNKRASLASRVSARWARRHKVTGWASSASRPTLLDRAQVERLPSCRTWGVQGGRKFGSPEPKELTGMNATFRRWSPRHPLSARSSLIVGRGYPRRSQAGRRHRGNPAVRRPAFYAYSCVAREAIVPAFFRRHGTPGPASAA